MKISQEIQCILEKNPVALASVMPDGKPNVIGVAYVKVIDNDKLVITDNYMNQTIQDVKHNPHVAVVVWDEDMNGIKLVGTAQYYDTGKWVDYVKALPENKEFPAKGAIIIFVQFIIKSK
jgi:predicted pyridoxine 5'-phosphate oxidase superfamily flavin-nucleotide-binding protein